MSLINILLVIWGMLEILFFAGIIFGWASLVLVLKSEQFFFSMCKQINDSSAFNDTRELQTFSNFGASLDDDYKYQYNGSVTASNQPIKQQLADPKKPSDLIISHPVSFIHGNLTVDLNGLTPKLSYNNINFSYNLNDANSSYKYSDRSLISQLGSIIKEAYNCKKQDEHFNLIYTIAVVICGISLFLNGWIMDHFGVRICRIIGIIAFGSSLLMLAYSNSTYSFILYPSISLLAYGGYFVLMTNFQLANLIPSKRSTIISLYCGAYDSSSSVLVLVLMAYNFGFSMQVCFLTLFACFMVVVLSTFWYMPRKRLPHPLPNHYVMNLGWSATKTRLYGDEEILYQQTSLPQNKSITANENNSLNPSVENQKSFLQVVKSPMFLWDVFWLTCHRFASWSFVGRLNTMLFDLADGDSTTVQSYTSVYASCQFFGIVLAPLSGLLMDRKPTKNLSTSHMKTHKVRMCTASFMIDTTIGLLLSITVCIPVLKIQYLSFVLHVLHRALLYGPNSAFIAQVFPVQHFGKVFGLSMSVAAAFALIQYPLFVLIQIPLRGNALPVNLFTVVLMLLSYGHPIYIWWWCKKRDKLS